ncbi:MAG: YggS family pyridoxal phosphate-dependent enzyme [Fluviibacter sp.]|jgi:pyridoxal phosphate enzyme (YggS family)
MIATQTDPFDGARRLNAVQQRIADAARGSGRAVDAVSLLAVSKTFPIEAVDAIADAGQHAFGENYAQEGIEKAVLRPDLEWHFIGPIQSNKTRGIAEHFDWVHTIDRLKIAERLSAQRPADKPPLQVCVQVNISGEFSKSGCTPDTALALCQTVAALPRLTLRGLMAIPEATADPITQHRHFAALRQLMAEINATDPSLQLDTLSMGMSDDLEAAIAEGATIVRVGSAIFGQRTYTHTPASTEL